MPFLLYFVMAKRTILITMYHPHASNVKEVKTLNKIKENENQTDIMEDEQRKWAEWVYDGERLMKEEKLLPIIVWDVSVLCECVYMFS